MDAPNGLGALNADFTYHPLEADTVRLVRFQLWTTSTDIHCSLSHQHDYFNDPVKYMALSYCWGQAGCERRITINGRAFHVGANLWYALAALWRHDPQIPFWVDAICINQQDVVERNAQVQQMWRIFGCAYRVDVWLGAGPDHAVDESLPSVASGSTTGDDHGHTRTQHFLRMLSTTPYFTRTWVIPEILQARAIFIMCGEECVPWSEFSLPIVEWLIQSTGENDTSLVQVRRLFEARWDVYDQANEQEPHMQFMKVIYLYIIGNCWDPRDKIFALLGHPLIRMMGDLINLMVDYRLSIEELALAVLAQYRRLDLRKSYSDKDENLVTFSADSYDTIMVWLQDMLHVSFASAAVGEVLRNQTVELKEVNAQEQTCFLAWLKNGEEILLTGDLLLHINSGQDGDAQPSTRCRVCSAVHRAQLAFDRSGCAAVSHPSNACDEQCQRRYNLLQQVIVHSLQSPNPHCMSCANRSKELGYNTSPA